MDLSNYAIKADLKGITGIDTSALALRTYLGILKTKVDGLGIDKLKVAPEDLNKLSKVVDNDVVKKLCIIH